jgi:hypothetical protein
MKAKGAGSQHTFWEVIMDEEFRDRECNNAITVALMAELNKQLKNVQAPTDHRLISPWLCTTHQHEYVGGCGFSTAQLCHSIALPQPNEANYKDLHVIIEDYFQGALVGLRPYSRGNTTGRSAESRETTLPADLEEDL